MYSAGRLQKDRMLGIGEFFAATVIATVACESLGSDQVVLRGFLQVRFLAEEEASAVKVDVRQVQPHRPALGNVPRFVQLSPRPLDDYG